MILRAPLSPHARLGASSAHRWMHCPGSIAMSEGLPSVDTDYQREGTAAHAVAAHALLTGMYDVTEVNVQRPDESWIVVPVDDEMQDGAKLFADAVRAVMGPSATLDIEQTFDLSTLGPPEPMYGTGDAVVLNGRKLHVFDLKYGKGVVVEVLDNEQLRMYVVGAVLKLGKGDLGRGLAALDEISVTIVQPRAAHRHGPVRTEELSPEQVRTFAKELIEAAQKTHLNATTGPYAAELRPGDWCKFCPARGHCPALQAAAGKAAALVFEEVPLQELKPALPDVEHLPIEVVAEMAQKLPILEDWARAVKDRVEQELKAGNKVPGFKLVAKRARRVWTQSEKELVDALARMGLNTNEIFDTRVKSPAQIEKIVGRKHLPDEMVASVSSGVTVAGEDDHRPALKSAAQEVFPALPPGSAVD